MKHLLNALMRIGRVKLVDDTGPIQRLQVDEGDLGSYGGRRVIDNVAHILTFGFASAPPLDAELLLGAPGGDRSQTIAFGSNHQPSRPRDLPVGDSCQYDVRGQRVWLSDAGIIIDGAGLDLPVTIRNVAKLRVEATQIECTGDVVANIDGTPISLAKLAAAYLAHHHSGVAAGTELTGTTDHTL